MHLTYRHELTKQAPLASDYANTSMAFRRGNQTGEDALASRVHKILALTFLCIDTWLKPLFSPVEKRKLTPI